MLAMIIIYLAKLSTSKSRFSSMEIMLIVMLRKLGYQIDVDLEIILTGLCQCR